MFLLNLFSATALVYEGYNQGVLGTVSATPGFIAMASIGYEDVVTDSTKQGGIAAAYYFGAIFGCLFGGAYSRLDTALAIADGYRLDGGQNRQKERRRDRERFLPARLCFDGQ